MIRAHIRTTRKRYGKLEFTAEDLLRLAGCELPERAQEVIAFHFDFRPHGAISSFASLLVVEFNYEEETQKRSEGFHAESRQRVPTE